MDFIISVALFFTWKLQDTKGNLPANLGIFYRISKKIYQDLFNAQLVAVYIQILDPGNIGGEFLILFQGLIFYDHTGLIYNVRNAAHCLIQFGLSAFNTADLQYFIDNAKEMIAGYLDLGKVILNLFPVLSRLFR